MVHQDKASYGRGLAWLSNTTVFCVKGRNYVICHVGGPAGCIHNTLSIVFFIRPIANHLYAFHQQACLLEYGSNYAVYISLYIYYDLNSELGIFT